MAERDKVAYLDYTYPRPADCDPAYDAAAREMGKTHSRDGCGDYEDWHECIARAMIAARAGMDFVTDADIDIDTPFWGPIGRWSGSLRYAEDARIGRYAFSPTFQRHSGRDIRLVKANIRNLNVSLHVAFNRGARAVWIKDALASKAFIARVTEPVIPEDMGWEIVRNENSPQRYMVYAEVEMAYEYRLFVVDGQVVCGAGCIESNTPLDNTERFDPVLEKRRGDGVGLIRPQIVEAYRVFGQRVADEFAAEGWRTYVMDVATSNGEPIVIELNGIHNAGLYALDIDALADAIVAAPASLALSANAIAPR